MTGEEAKYRLEIALKCIGCERHCYDDNNVVTCEYYEDKCRLDLREAIQTAISNGLSQEPTFDDECQKDMDEAWEQIQKKRKRIPVTLDLTPCDDAISREAVIEWLENATYEDISDAVGTELSFLPSVTQKPIECDAISRILKRMWNCRGKHTTSIDKVKMEQIIHDELHSVTYKSIECDDAVSREAVIKTINNNKADERDGWLCIDNDLVHEIEKLPSVTQKSGKWIPVSERLPEDTYPVNITWVNHDPEPYYATIKDKPFTATGCYCDGKWYWYSVTCQDYLDEYRYCDVDSMDEAIEVIAWMPLPEPYEPQESEEQTE